MQQCYLFVKCKIVKPGPQAAMHRSLIALFLVVWHIGHKSLCLVAGTMGTV